MEKVAWFPKLIKSQIFAVSIIFLECCFAGLLSLYLILLHFTVAWYKIFEDNHNPFLGQPSFKRWLHICFSSICLDCSIFLLRPFIFYILCLASEKQLSFTVSIKRTFEVVICWKVFINHFNKLFLDIDIFWFTVRWVEPDEKRLKKDFPSSKIFSRSQSFTIKNA